MRFPGRPLRRLLASSAALLALSACASSGPSGGDGATVSLLLPPGERPFWEPIRLEFERRNPGTRVSLIEGPQSADLRENLYTTALLARDPTFDLVYMDVTWTAKFAAAGWLVPLDDRFRAEELEALLPVARAAGEYRGRLYRVPVRTDLGLLYHRSDLLEQAGLAPPATFADLEHAARMLQSPPGRWGFVWQGRQYEGLVCDFLEVLHGHGGYWVDPGTLEVGLDRPEAVAALGFLVRCLRERPISPPGTTTYQEDESRRLFQDGRAVFLRNWPYVWRLAQASESPVRGRIGVGPMVHAPGARSAGTLGGWGLGVSTYSRHPALAVEFIRLATSAPAQRELCAPTGYAPARMESYADPALLAANPFLSQLGRLSEHAVARPALPRYALASDILQRHVSAALAGSDDPGRALRRAARETRALLGDARGPVAKEAR